MSETSAFWRTLDVVSEKFGQPMLKGMEWAKRNEVRAFRELSKKAKKVGYRVIRTSKLPATQKLGGVSLVDQGEKYIMVDKTKSPEYQEFTLAHELGHHELNHVNENTESARDGLGNTQQEIQANLFGLGILNTTATAEEKERYLKENPREAAEVAVVAATSGIALTGALLYDGVKWLMKKISTPEPSNPAKEDRGSVGSWVLGAVLIFLVIVIISKIQK